MNKLIALAVVSTFAGSAFAAPETFAIDSSHTSPRFEYSHFGYSNQVQRFDKTTGTIVLDRAAKTASVDVSIDVMSVNTGNPLFTGHLLGEDFFDVQKNPTITFKSRKVVFNSDKPVKVEGDLTIKGVTKPVTLDVSSFHAMPHPMAKRDAIGANASVKIKRSDFNMGKFAPYVSDDVTLTIAVEAIKP